MKKFVVLMICLAFIFPATAMATKKTKGAVFFVGDQVKYKRQVYRVTRVMQARECLERVPATWYTLRKKDVTPIENFAIRADDPLLTGGGSDIVTAKPKKGESYKIMDLVMYDGEICTIRAIIQQEECAEDGWSVFTTYQITPESGRGNDVVVRQDEKVLSLKMRK